jgi:hypothetical protein
MPGKPGQPHDPDEPPPPGSRPFCHERGKSPRESRHHRPDRSPHRQSEDASHRAHWSHHREGRTRQVTVGIRAVGRHGPRTYIREHPVELPRAADWARRHITSHRRSAMTERPFNVRTGQVLERTHNSRRHHAEHPEVPAQSRAYRGSHRAERMHRADDTNRPYDLRNGEHRGDYRNADHASGGDWSAAADRSSRVGRHHADGGGRW